MTNRRQFVGNHDGSSIDGSLVECLLNFSLGVWVEGACGFVKEQDGGVGDDGTGDGYTLLLASTKKTGSFTDMRFVGLGYR